MVGLKHSRGIGASRFGREGLIIDDVTAERFQRDTVLRFKTLCAGLGKLARDASDFYDGNT